ncbi:carboxylesterase [Marinihelvus fidelis]|uniref:Carboxylesterase n=1 Tax=Marinihelvus fidelis TaxID=2613842 RepID=A0A5N0TBY2_9GAMM|nr:dienelactone hydrolase family protein [Marinihelvus fidelis]KAA9130849.1 carboxylesterase [Marinihelvus fidelis]
MKEATSATGDAAPEQGVTLPETVEVVTGVNPTHAVIWLHGLGADGHDFEPVVPQLGLGGGPPTRFVFPHAPVRPVTLNGGMPMRAWYDIVSISASRDLDMAGIEQSRRLVDALVNREMARGIASGNIVLAGFSQGGAMALHAGLRFPHTLAGIMSLSAYLLAPDRLADERAPANADTPVFIAHGQADPVVPFVAGDTAARQLREMGYPVEWRQYPIPHSVSMDELVDIGHWLRARLV